MLAHFTCPDCGESVVDELPTMCHPSDGLPHVEAWPCCCGVEMNLMSAGLTYWVTAGEGGIMGVTESHAAPLPGDNAR